MRKFNANRVLGCCAPVIFEAALSLLAIPATDWWNANQSGKHYPRGSLNYPETLLCLNMVAATVIGVGTGLYSIMGSTVKTKEDEAPYSPLGTDTGTP